MKTRACYMIELKDYIHFKRIIKKKGLKIGFVVEKLVQEYIKNNQIPITCPKCNSTNVIDKEYITHIDYTCNDCNHTWTENKDD